MDTQVRQRFGLLVVGYNTHRGSLVMAWEPLVVMLRKLFITLAGSALDDPHVQIMVALVILVCSLAVQALVQPYESVVLNILDVLSLLALVITQVLSIMYLYLDNLEDDEPLGIDRNVLEITITIALFALNIGVIIVLLVCFLCRYTYEQVTRDGRRSKKPRGRLSLTLEHLGAELGLEMLSLKVDQEEERLGLEIFSQKADEEEERLGQLPGGPARRKALTVDGNSEEMSYTPRATINGKNPLALQHGHDGDMRRIDVEMSHPLQHDHDGDTRRIEVAMPTQSEVTPRFTQIDDDERLSAKADGRTASDGSVVGTSAPVRRRGATVRPTSTSARLQRRAKHAAERDAGALVSDGASALATPAMATPASGAAPAGEEELPPGWEVTDDGYGNTYYYHEATNESVWAKPATRRTSASARL